MGMSPNFQQKSPVPTVNGSKDTSSVPLSIEKSPMEQIDFQNGNQVEIDRESKELRIIGIDGNVSLRIYLTEQGPVIDLKAAAFRIQADQQIQLESPQIHIKAGEKLTLSSEGDLSQEVKGDIHSKARIQNIEADLGNVNIKANDDVKLDGERVKLNCDT